jgi:hypothetical protein
MGSTSSLGHGFGIRIGRNRCRRSLVAPSENTRAGCCSVRLKCRFAHYSVSKSVFPASSQRRSIEREGTSVTNSIGCRGMRLLAFVVLIAVASWAQQRPPIAKEIAKTYGLDSWDKVDAIRYTWNGEITGLFKVSRSWEWEPKTGKVSYSSKDKDGKPVNVSFVLSQIGSAPADVKDKIEPAFVNDQYWTLFPLHVYWDSSANVQDLGMQKLPIGNGSARKVVVKYPAEAGGFTPGDTWELFLGSNGRVEQFIYRRGGSQKPSIVIATWVGYKKAGPLLISTEHRGTADGKLLHIFLTNVAVKLTGSDAWVNAE